MKKNPMSTSVITLKLSLPTTMSTMHFLTEIIFILKVTKSHSKESYDKQNLTLMVILYEIKETHQRLVA